MKFRQFIPFIIVISFMAVMLQIGCDTLITENNTTILVDSTLAIGCFDCHTDENNPLLRPRGQFNNSTHSNYSDLGIVEKDSKCRKCHTNEGYINAFDPAVPSFTPAGYSAINCFTCHLPHPDEPGSYGNWEIDTLRASDQTDSLPNGSGTSMSITSYSPSNNCIHCHTSTQGSSPVDPAILVEGFGPHSSPQTDIVSGKNGFFVVFDTPNSNAHLENGCINCHFGTTGEGQGYSYAEHTFRLEDKNTLQQYNNTCIGSGCHTDLDAEVLDFYTSPAISFIDTLAESTKTLLLSYEVIDLVADTSGLTFIIDDTIPKILADLYYNYLLFKNDGSRGIHNPSFVTSLLDTTIDILDSLPPIGTFTVDNDTACVNIPSEFTPTIIGAFDELIWDFGDNSIPDTLTAVAPIFHTYTDTGIYTVTLTSVSLWTNDDTLLVPAAETLAVVDLMLVDVNPIADFVKYDTLLSIDTLVLNDTICLGEEYSFYNRSIHTASATYTWDFGDGKISVQAGDSLIVTKTYTTIGTFDVSLTVETRCSTDVKLRPAHITVEGVIPVFSFNTVDSVTYTFTDLSIGTADLVIWDFEGNGTHDSTGISPINHTYTTSGSYNATLIVYKNSCSIVDSLVQIITVP